MDNKQPPSLTNNVSKRVILNQITKDVTSNSDLWTDGLICAFEFVRRQRPPSLDKSNLRTHLGNRRNDQTYDRKDSRRASKNLNEQDSVFSSSILELNSKPPVLNVDEAARLSDSKDKDVEPLSYSHWIPVGWSRISELVQKVKVDEHCVSQQMNFANGDDDTTVADVATPYWERPEGPTWWCHVAANHPSITSWLNNAQWLYPAISVALRDESRLISERMKYLLYEVPVRVAGGLLFELLGQSVGDPFSDEDDIPVVLRSWQAQNFLVSSLHIKGSAANINVLGITEVQELLLSGGTATPKSIQEVIAHLTSRLARWDDRLFRKYVFGAADEIELKFVNRRNHEDMNMLCVILNREIRKLAMQVIRVKWSLHAREEIVFELLQHLKGPIARSMLEGIRKSTREMLDEQEAVRGRLFTIQDVMQSTVRAWLQDKSFRVTHNLAIFGGCGLVLSIITGLFGINVDGIPGAENKPYAFALFTGILLFVGFVLIGLGMLYLGLKKPIDETKVNIRKMELEQMVSVFQHDAETHAKVRQDVSRHNLPPTAADTIHDADYVLID